jgi:hypothetical protein
MAMQDKEFDDLFRSKLDGFETEPSPAVWNNVAGRLDAGKRRKVFVPFLSIAASVIVLVAAGVLFIPQKQTTGVKHTGKKEIAKNSVPLSAASRIINAKPDSVQTPAGKQTKNIISVYPIAVTHAVVPGKYSTAKNEKAAVDTAQPLKTNEQQALVAVTPAKQNVAVPINDAPLKPIDPVKDNAPAVTQPVLAAVVPVQDKPDDAPVKKKHRIRSLGDLVNVVVAKVDKRKDKIIEFTDDDDDSDESNVTAVNIGVLKIKKDK